MSEGDRSDTEEERGLVRRWLRRADEFLKGTDSVHGKAGGALADPISDPIAARRLGQLLIEDGVLTWEQLSRGLLRQREQGARTGWRTLGEVIVDMGLATDAQVQAAIARQVREDHLRSTR